jgi:hypothetical protein
LSSIVIATEFEYFSHRVRDKIVYQFFYRYLITICESIRTTSISVEPYEYRSYLLRSRLGSVNKRSYAQTNIKDDIKNDFFFSDFLVNQMAADPRSEQAKLENFTSSKAKYVLEILRENGLEKSRQSRAIIFVQVSMLRNFLRPKVKHMTRLKRLARDKCSRL